MKQILALLSWGQICILKEPEAFTFAKMEVGHPVNIYFVASPQMNMTLMKHIIDVQKNQEVISCPYLN